MLTDLAVPRVGEGPAIDAQKALVDDLEARIKNREFSDGSEYNLGGILIDGLPKKLRTDKDKQFAQLAPTAKLVALPPGVRTGGTGLTLPPNVIAAISDKVVENTLKTMIDAEQIKYLRKAGIPDDDWKIIAEVHYIRARPKDMAGFHKDTKGQTLFVNLNYHIGQDLRGPEYVLNPPRSEEHHQQGKETLPKQFRRDLKATRDALSEPEEIESSGTVKPYGYVAFVDEAIHHATPWFGHRYVTALQFEDYLNRHYGAELGEIRRADEAIFNRRVKKDIIPSHEKDKWRTWLKMTKADPATRYTREDLKGTMSDDAFDRMLEDVGKQVQTADARKEGAAPGWYAASIPNPKGGSVYEPIKKAGKAPLRRQASQADVTKNLPDQLPEDVPRRFLRTWVRVVPKATADKLTT